MADLSKIVPGLSGSAQMTVTGDKLATVVGSGNAPVFASPMLAAVIEAAAVATVEHLLPEAHQSLGTHLDIAHTAPTPAGLTVTATAKLVDVNGRKLTFEVEAHDGVEAIGGGTHTRVVVDIPRFEARVKAKSPPSA